MDLFKKFFFTVTLILYTSNISAEIKEFNMVFVPASEKGDENDYTNLIKSCQSSNPSRFHDEFCLPLKKRNMPIKNATFILT